MSAVSTSKKTRLTNTALFASASLMSLMMAGEAQAACTPTPGQPLNNITSDFSFVDCNGPNTNETIVVNANAAQVEVRGAGDTLNNSTLTFNGDAHNFRVLSGGSIASTSVVANGAGNVIRIGAQGSGIGTASNFSLTLNGEGGALEIGAGSTVSANPGQLQFTNATSGGFQGINVFGTLAATGNSGGSFLITGGVGSQDMNLYGTLTVQPNGLAYSGGADADNVTIWDTGVVNGGTGNNILFDGGSGNDSFTIFGGGARSLNTANFEELNLSPGSGNTLALGGSGNYTLVRISAGTVEVATDAPLGQSNSDIEISPNGRLRLAPTAPFTFGHSLYTSVLNTAVIEQTGQTITYNGGASSNGPWRGNFLLSGGTAIINNGAQFGTGTITNNAALQLTNITLNNNIGGTGTVTKIGAGTGTLGGASTYNGGTSVLGGTLRLTHNNAAGTNSITLANGTFLDLDLGAASASFSNAITGGGGLIKSGSGTIDLVGSNTYSGGTTINAGAIRVDAFSRLGTGPVVANFGGSLILDYSGVGQLLQTTPFMTGAGSFIKEGSGDVVMDQVSTFTGGTIIREGRIGLNDGDALGTGNIQVDSGAELGIGGIVLNNSITGSGLVRKTASNIAELYGDNSGFNGVMRVEDGTILVTNGNSFGAGTLQIDSGTSAEINAAGDSAVAAGLAGSGVFEKYGSGLVTLTGDGTAFTGTVSITNGALQIAGSQNVGGGTILIGNAGTLRLDTTGLTSLNNTILGGGNVIKAGTGTVFVTGSNAYTGGTQIQEGAIRVTDTSFLGTGPINVQFGAALDLAIAGQQTLSQSITGAGILRKSDTGDLTLLGNGLTGGVDIVGGRVIVGTTAALGGGPVSMAADTQLVFDTNGTEVMANPISGMGALTKDGTGSMIIQNANIYTGGTLINAGRIGLNNGQGLGTGDVIVFQDAILNLGNVTVANNITGAGLVVKTASGTGSLTGTNSHSGGTDIQGGTLVVTSPAALGSGGVSIATGATLDINYNGGTNAALGNVLSGGGSLIKNGSGTVVMNTGGNTYSGGTTISAGRLGLNFGDALGTGNVAINAGASLALGDVTYANTTSGAGQIIKTSAGTTTLTGTNSHTGGIAIQAGTLAVTGNGSLGSGAVIIASGAQLNYTNTAAATFSNGLSGPGTFSKLGTGQLNFANNFTLGALNLSAGRTRMNVIGTTNVTVGANATLDGTGRIIGNLINNGTVAPGNSIGTLTVQGNYTHNSGSVLEVEFDAAGNIDLLDVTGNATLNGGTLRFVSIGGAEGQGGTFLRTGGTLTGTFATVETVGALLPLAVVYEPNRAFMAPSVLTARPSTFNAQSLAAADTALGFIDSMGVGDARHGEGNRIWMTGFGAWGNRSASGTTLAYDHNTRGLSGGVNFGLGDAITMGLSVGWAKGDITLGNNGGGGDQSSILGGLNLRYAGEGFTLGGGVVYGKVDQDTLRNVSFNGFSGSVNGETESRIFGAFADLGLPLGTTGDWSFSANARGSYVRQKQDGYTESGTSPLRLTLGDLKTSTLEGQAHLSARTSLWAPGQYAEDTPEGLGLRIDLGGRYHGTLGDREIPVTFAVSNAGIVLQGDTRNTLQGMAGLSLDYTTRGGATISLGYRGEFGTTDRHAVQAGVSFAF